MNAKLDYSSEIMEIKKEQISYNEDYCTADACDQIVIEERLVKSEYNLTDEWELRDNIYPGHFIAPEDVKEEDVDVSTTIESITDPISIGEGDLICDYCKRAFTTPEYCKKHMRRCRNRVYHQPSTSTDNISIAAVRDENPRLNNDHGGLFRCNHCDNNFKSRMGLYYHACRHSRMRLYTCKDCSKQFAAPCYLARHMLIHTKEKPNKCTMCEAAFIQASSLKLHMLTHSGVRVHKCTQCSKSFSKSCHLTRHMRTHTAEKPYQCTQCGISFSQSNSLTRHVRTHTGEKPFKCTVCNYAYAHSTSLKSHMKKHSGESNKP